MAYQLNVSSDLLNFMAMVQGTWKLLWPCRWSWSRHIVSNLKDRATIMRRTFPGCRTSSSNTKTPPSSFLCSLCCTFLKSGRLLCRLQLFGCHIILRVSTVAVHFLLCVYLPLAAVDGRLASALWIVSLQNFASEWVHILLCTNCLVF